MKRGAVFYNVGRGDTVDQVSLRTALETEHLAAVYLDVAMPEPLPKDDPLWSTPNCHITRTWARRAERIAQARAAFLAEFRHLYSGRNIARPDYLTCATCLANDNFTCWHSHSPDNDATIATRRLLSTLESAPGIPNA